MNKQVEKPFILGSGFSFCRPIVQRYVSVSGLVHTQPVISLLFLLHKHFLPLIYELAYQWKKTRRWEK